MLLCQATWTSLEIAKLIVQGLTPIIVVTIGLLVNRKLKSLEHSQWANQKLVEKRIQIFDQLGPIANDLLCFFTYVGHWKQLTPPEIIQLKRQIDKIAYINSPLFDQERFFHLFNAFIDLCFRQYAGWGNEPKIRSKLERRTQIAGSAWEDEWNELFDKTNIPPEDAVRDAYSEFMSFLAGEVGIGMGKDRFRSGAVPGGIK